MSRAVARREERLGDVILDFVHGEDRIDLRALGFTGLGDGTAGTRQVTYSEILNRTYLKNLDADGAGHRFELSLDGNHRRVLEEKDFLFAAQSSIEPRIETLGIADMPA